MNREIKFRAKAVNGWRYGSLVSCRKGWNPNGSERIFYIVYPGEHGIAHDVVKENTIGQYIGLKDKNGKDIYEGDILKMTDPDDGITWNTEVGTYGEVEYHTLDYDFTLLKYIDELEYEVIGNIYDGTEQIKQHLIHNNDE